MLQIDINKLQRYEPIPAIRYMLTQIDITDEMVEHYIHNLTSYNAIIALAICLSKHRYVYRGNNALVYALYNNPQSTHFTCVISGKYSGKYTTDDIYNAMQTYKLDVSNCIASTECMYESILCYNIDIFEYTIKCGLVVPYPFVNILLLDAIKYGHIDIMRDVLTLMLLLTVSSGVIFDKHQQQLLSTCHNDIYTKIDYYYRSQKWRKICYKWQTPKYCSFEECYLFEQPQRLIELCSLRQRAQVSAKLKTLSEYNDNILLESDFSYTDDCIVHYRQDGKIHFVLSNDFAHALIHYNLDPNTSDEIRSKNGNNITTWSEWVNSYCVVDDYVDVITYPHVDIPAAIFKYYRLDELTPQHRYTTFSKLQ